MKKRRVLYFLLFAVVLTANILIVVSQISNVKVSTYSLPALLCMIIMAIHAVLSYLLRNKGNFLPFSRLGSPNPFADDKDYTFEDSYVKRFFFMLKVYCLAIPFYIPQIFLTSSYAGSFWALVVFFAPQVVYVVMESVDISKDVKDSRARQEQLEKERVAQEQREELGKWK